MKKLVVHAVLLIFIIFLVNSCKKDDDSTPDYVSGISGGWKYLSGAQNEKYLQVYQNRTCSMLSSDDQGIRDRQDATILVTNNQIMIDKGSQMGGSVSIFNYTLKKDTLILTQPSLAITLVLDKTAPDTAAWVKTVSVTAQTKAPISDPTDITYDGALIWCGNAYSSHYLYSINPTNFTMDSVKIGQYAWAVEADGNNLWVSSDGSSTISELNKSTGTTITTSVSMGAWIYGIAKDNNYLWCYSSNEGMLYKYNSTTNTVDLTTSISSYWNGMALVNGYLYVASNGKLHKCTLAPLMGTASFDLPGYYIYGVAYDGNSFWVSAYALPNGWPQIMKLSGVQ